MTDPETTADVVVVGAGNAALSAAIEAADAGARVLVLEKAPAGERGGNTRFTGGLLRFAFDSPAEVLALVSDHSVVPDGLDIGDYPELDYLSDIGRLGGGRPDVTLATTLVRGSRDAVQWLTTQGIRLEFYEKHVEHGGVRSWPDHALLKVTGGGEGMSAALFDAANRRGVTIRYGAQVVGIDLESIAPRIRLRTRQEDGLRDVTASAVVVASGGFEASAAARAAYLGAGWDLAKVRGTRHNTGEVLLQLVSAGAGAVGNWSGAHAVPVDAGSGEVGDLAIGALTTRLSYPYGISVNSRGERFVDEGADFKLLTYAKMGRDILAQPHGVVYQVFDQQSVPLLEPRYALGSPPHVADSIEALAQAIGIPVAALVSTVAAYNDSLGAGDFNPAIRDGVATHGITPPKSNWALQLSSPPFVAYAVSCAITFTYGGLQIDPEARVMSSGGVAIPGLFAAGEITGAFFYDNYPAGAGLVRGTVFGRIAGRNAANRAKELAP